MVFVGAHLLLGLLLLLDILALKHRKSKYGKLDLEDNKLQKDRSGFSCRI